MLRDAMSVQVQALRAFVTDATGTDGHLPSGIPNLTVPAAYNLEVHHTSIALFFWSRSTHLYLE